MTWRRKKDVPDVAEVDVGSGPLLELRDVGKAFVDRRRVTWAVRGVSLSVREGEFVSIVGRSGCGKTTLIRIVDHLLPPTEGVVVISGKVVDEVPSDVAFVFQQVNLLPWRSVLKNVELALIPFGWDQNARRERAMEALDLVGLVAHCDWAPYQLSGGMQQRVGVARALAVRPKLLLMDEPFGQLDSFTRENLQHDFAKLHAKLGMTVLFVTHDIDEAILLSSRIVVMEGGPGCVVADLEVPLRGARWEYDAHSDAEWARLRRTVVGALSDKRREGDGLQ